MKKIIIITTLLFLTFSISAQGKAGDLKAVQAYQKAILLDNQIKEKAAAIENELSKNMKLLDGELAKELEKINKLAKDEFETTSEFNARKESQRVATADKIEAKRQDYKTKVYQVEKDQKLTALNQELSDLMSKTYDLNPDWYKIDIGAYNADKNFFEIKFDYFVKTVGAKNIWDSTVFRWEIEREKAKNIGPIRKDLIKSVKASVLKIGDTFYMDRYEVVVLDPKSQEVYFSTVLYKETKVRISFLQKDPNVKIYTPAQTGLRLREAPSNGKIIRNLKDGEMVMLLKKGKTETLDGFSGTWVLVQSFDTAEEGWCFDAFLKEYKP